MTANVVRVPVTAAEWTQVVAALAPPDADGVSPSELTLTQFDGRRVWAIKDRWRMVVIRVDDLDDRDTVELDLALDPAGWFAHPPADAVLHLDLDDGTASLDAAGASVTGPLPDLRPLPWLAALNDGSSHPAATVCVGHDALFTGLAALAQTLGRTSPGFGELGIDGNGLTLASTGHADTRITIDADTPAGLSVRRTVLLDGLFGLRAVSAETVELTPASHPRLPTLATAGNTTVMLWSYDPVTDARSYLCDTLAGLDLAETSTLGPDGEVELHRPDRPVVSARISPQPGSLVTVSTVIAGAVERTAALDAELGDLNTRPGPRLYVHGGQVHAAVDIDSDELDQRLGTVLDTLDDTVRRYEPMLAAYFGADAGAGR